MINARNMKGYVDNTKEGLTTKKVVIGSSIIAASVIGGSLIISKGIAKSSEDRNIANMVTKIYTTFLDKVPLEDIKKLEF